MPSVLLDFFRSLLNHAESFTIVALVLSVILSSLAKSRTLFRLLHTERVLKKDGIEIQLENKKSDRVGGLISRGALRGLEIQGPKDHSQDVATIQVEARMPDLITTLAEETRVEKMSKWAAYSLTFGQYIVGGVLASSFVQDTLSKNAIGTLGLLVLMATLIRQKFKPNAERLRAQERCILLREAIRKAEDNIFMIFNNVPGSKSLLEIRTSITETLCKIDRERLQVADADE